MAFTALNQELWSSLLIASTKESMAFTDIFKPGKVHGKSLHLTDIGSVIVSAYTKDTDISNQTLTDSDKELLLNQQSYFSVAVDQIDIAQTDADIMKEILTRGSNGIKKAFETYIGSLHAGASVVTALGTSTTPIEIDEDNILVYIRKMARLLDQASADPDRWMVVPAFFKEDLITALPALSTNNTEMLANGKIGRFCGFDIYMSNNLAQTTGTKYKILAGDKASMVAGVNVDTIESLKNPNYFGDILRALYIYGSKVVRPSTLACLTANEA